MGTKVVIQIWIRSKAHSVFLKEQHRDFGGVIGWEYFNSLVGEEDKGEPEEWARIMAGLMNRRAEQDGSDVVRELALR